VLLSVILVLVIVFFVLGNPEIMGPSTPLYQHQQSYSEYSQNGDHYRFVVVTDMDVDSRVGTTDKWRGILKSGILKRDSSGSYTVSWKDETELFGKYNEGGRGMELSELVYFNKKLLTCDDRSGIVFEVDMKTNNVYPLYVFSGNEAKEKGFKCEWMTVKDDTLYIGSMGKEWTSLSGEHINNDPLFVQTVKVDGTTASLDWSENFHRIDREVGIESSSTGYMVHEAVNWDPVSKTWIFLPRRVSKEVYNANTEGEKGSNLMIVASEDFGRVNVSQLGDLIATHGFSSFKFIPHRHHEVIVLKSVEHDSVIETYIAVFNLVTQQVLMKETMVGKYKFEGIEFI